MTRHRNPITTAECIAAIREAGSIQHAALLLGVSSGIIYSRLKAANVDIDTLEVRPPLIYEPGEELDYQRATIRLPSSWACGTSTASAIFSNTARTTPGAACARI